MSDVSADEEFRRRARQKLATGQIIWLVTTGSAGRPQPSPVWFLWDGAPDDTIEGTSLVVYSKPDAPKTRAVAVQPLVALHFDTDPDGHDVVILGGRAVIDVSAPPCDHIEEYVDKYRAGINGLGLTASSFAAEYRTAIRVTIERVRGF